ncbi:unnamed protein product [Penicillium nalgiovense]|uniref:Uncharacterized protein n=1 Tax=Penicillium salamii TaxID=1612424 RepID=A0A9W4IEV6_9EURO|nr:unnamed protein product [Penicillium salamii]CAG8882123.1 unnamed protein product [Penicillium nalgiovense]CAG8142154.1 unnamed protein product [Penicillium salamii]CAG8146567.1 unnamed protein product [Penicillium salamii]CAG8236856.1 unnamed protein product [Penicillium salamii]
MFFGPESLQVNKMDAPQQLPDQDRVDRQPSKMPTENDEAYPQAVSDPQPPLQEAILKKHPAVEQFQPILEILADLDRDDPKLAFQAARPVGLFRRLWAPCEPKHSESEIPDENGRAPKEATAKLSNGRDGFQLRPDEQLSRLVSLEQALEQTQERLISVLKDWNQSPRGDLAMLMDIERCS